MRPVDALTGMTVDERGSFFIRAPCSEFDAYCGAVRTKLSASMVMSRVNPSYFLCVKFVFFVVMADKKYLYIRVKFTWS